MKRTDVRVVCYRMLFGRYELCNGGKLPWTILRPSARITPASSVSSNWHRNAGNVS
jgi:hypothetical protein